MKIKLTLCSILLLVFFMPRIFFGFEEIRMLTLGMEASGRLDNKDHCEDEYRLKLSIPRGVYRLAVIKLSGGYPGICFSSDFLDEDICISPFSYEKSVFILTLPAGEYNILVENELSLPSLSYKIMLELLSPWNDSMEWEPNEEPNQNIKLEKQIKGQILGNDEDNFRFTVPPNHAPAYDFCLKTNPKESLLFKVGDGNEEQEQCQVGVKTKDGYIIQGLVLDKGQYVISILLSPITFVSKINKADPLKMKFPTIPYILEVKPNNYPFCKLISEDQAFMSLFEAKSGDDISDIEIKEKVSPRKQIELNLYEFNQIHLKKLSEKHPLYNLNLQNQEFPARFLQLQRDVAQVREDVISILLKNVREDPHIKNACQKSLKRFGPMSIEQAKAFSDLWPNWSDVPDEWAAEILDGYAAQILKRVVCNSNMIISAKLISSSGLLVASTKIPSQLWQGSNNIWKKWFHNNLQVASTTPILAEHLNRRTMKTAFSVLDKNDRIGVLIIRIITGN